MSPDLLLEIGTEEIPAGYLDDALEDMKELAAKLLKDNRIVLNGDIEAFGTPRRLILTVTELAAQQEDLFEEVTGPPRKVAFDAEGRPTKAALGFAERQGVGVEELGVVRTPKGEYLLVQRHTPGRPTREILAEVLPRLIAEIPWPKSMRWGSLNFAFARPIHWIVALLGGEVVPFEVAGIKSGRLTRGHRFMAPEPQAVSDIPDYRAKMEAAHVVINPAQRRRLVEQRSREAAAAVKGRLADDPELVSIVANLVEYPTAVCGTFDASFLRVPEPVLITAMREHQKYFAVYDAAGRLMPYFVAVNNTRARDEAVVCRGHERVLRARLSDATFFFEEDRKKSLLDRLEDLKDVIYQADLGTSYAKVARFSALALELAERLFPERADEVELVARLCKCDLDTHMVSEFPSLQGIMGREYALLEGYPAEVAQAVYEHYLPSRAGGELPASAIAAVVGLADRMDTICGCFAVGLEPTGNTDPFALRRHALAIIRILEATGWELSLPGLVRASLQILARSLPFDPEALFLKILDFFRERYRQMLLRDGYESELIEAVIVADFDRLAPVRGRIADLSKFVARSEDFQGLTQAVKRVGNMLKKQAEIFEVDPALFAADCEGSLWATYVEVRDAVSEHLAQGAYQETLQLLVRLRAPVDAFFEGVEIMTSDKGLCRNRIAVLQALAGLFGSVCDFSRFSG